MEKNLKKSWRRSFKQFFGNRDRDKSTFATTQFRDNWVSSTAPPKYLFGVVCWPSVHPSLHFGRCGRSGPSVQICGRYEQVFKTLQLSIYCSDPCENLKNCSVENCVSFKFHCGPYRWHGFYCLRLGWVCG